MRHEVLLIKNIIASRMLVNMWVILCGSVVNLNMYVNARAAFIRKNIVDATIYLLNARSSRDDYFVLINLGIGQKILKKINNLFI